MLAESSVARLRLALRVVVFVAAVAYIWGGPFLRQVADVRGQHISHLPRWIMFSSTALRLLDVRYERQRADGTREQLDHVALLGGTAPARGESRARDGFRLTDRDVKRLRRITEKLCRELGPDDMLFLTTRVATRAGWETVSKGDVDVCKRGDRRGPTREEAQ